MHFSMSHKVLRGEPVSKLSCHEMRASPDLSLFSKSEPSKDTHELNGSNYWPTETEERLTKWLQVSLGFYWDGSQAFCEHPLLKEDRHARFEIIFCWIESLLKQEHFSELLTVMVMLIQQLTYSVHGKINRQCTLINLVIMWEWPDYLYLDKLDFDHWPAYACRS